MTAIATTRQITVARGLAVLLSAFLIYMGVGFLVDPHGSAASFGVPTWTHADGDAFLAMVKGDRDIAFGLVILAVTVTATPRVLGWALLAAAVAPVGDMLIVLSSGGSPAVAFGVHGAAALFVALSGLFALTRAGGQTSDV